MYSPISKLSCKEHCRNCQHIISLKMSLNPILEENSPGQETRELPTISVPGTKSLRHLSGESTKLPLEVFPAILTDCPVFYDAEFIAELIKAYDILKCIVEALKAKTYDQSGS